MPVLLLGYFCARERPSGRRRGLRDCSRVRVTSTARYVGQMAPDERRAAKEAGRQLQLRPATWQKRVSVDNAVSRIVLHSLGISRDVRPLSCQTIQATGLLTTFSARGWRLRREWRFRSASIWKCADRGPTSDFRPCSSRPRSQQARRSSPAAGSRAHKYPYPPTSSPLFAPSQGVGRERIFRARQPPRLREPRFRWLLDVLRLSRDHDRQTEI